MRIKIKNIVILLAICIGLILIRTNVYASTAKTINDSTRMRKKASTSSDIVETIAKNETVEVVSEEGDWYKVKFKTSEGVKEGYIRGDLLEVEKTDNKKEEPNTSTENEKKEENNESNKSKITIKENTELKLKSETQLKLLPVIFSCKTGTIKADTNITITEIIGNWCRIQSDNQEGWVMTSTLESETEVESSKKEETKTEEKKEENTESKKEETTNTKLYVSTTTLNVREKADAKSEVLTQLDRNDEVTVLEVTDDTWTKIKYGKYTGYVASQYLSKTSSRGTQETRSSEETKTNNTKTETTKKEEKSKTTATTKKKTETTSTNKKTETKTETTTKKTETKKETETKKSSSKVTGADIIAYAKKYLGCKYVYGATGPKTFDCSGFTQFVYKHFGYSISRTSTSQRGDGKVIKSKSNLQLGDIVCFPGHVGLYVGDGNFIHASHTGSDVKISSLSSSYYKNKFIQGTRILK